MTDKDPKDMTVSEQLRWAANGEPYNGIDENIWTYPTGKIRALAEAVTGEWPSDNEIFSIVADKIDAELAEARELSLLRGAEIWVKANGWPDFREGEDFGAWLARCTYKKPVDDCNEPVQFGDDIELHYRGGGVDKGCFQEVAINKGPVSILSFVGVSHARDYRYDSECDILKRPAPEVLGADGLPLDEDDTVYGMGREQHRYTVQVPYSINEVLGQRFCVQCYDHDEGNITWCDPSMLTHTLPDTQERIDEDALKSCVQYWGCNDLSCGKCPALIDGKKPVEFYELDPIHDSCHEAQRLDLLRRQRELDKRTGGAE